MYSFDSETQHANIAKVAEALASERQRQQSYLQAVLRAGLGRALPHHEIREFDQSCVLPSLVIAHLQATLSSGQMFSIPRLALEGAGKALTSIQGVLSIAAQRPDKPSTLEVDQAGELLDIDVDPVAEEESVDLPAGKTVFFQVVHSSPHKQRLLHAAAVSGRFSASDVLVRFFDVQLHKRRFQEGGGVVLLHAQPRALGCLNIKQLSSAILVSGIRLWTQEPGFEYHLPVECDQKILQELVIATGQQGTSSSPLSFKVSCKSEE